MRFPITLVRFVSLSLFIAGSLLFLVGCETVKTWQNKYSDLSKQPHISGIGYSASELEKLSEEIDREMNQRFVQCGQNGRRYTRLNGRLIQFDNLYWHIQIKPRDHRDKPENNDVRLRGTITLKPAKVVEAKEDEQVSYCEFNAKDKKWSDLQAFRIPGSPLPIEIEVVNQGGRWRYGTEYSAPFSSCNQLSNGTPEESDLSAYSSESAKDPFLLHRQDEETKNLQLLAEIQSFGKSFLEDKVTKVGSKYYLYVDNKHGAGGGMFEIEELLPIKATTSSISNEWWATPPENKEEEPAGYLQIQGGNIKYYDGYNRDQAFSVKTIQIPLQRVGDDRWKTFDEIHYSAPSLEDVAEYRGSYFLFRNEKEAQKKWDEYKSKIFTEGCKRGTYYTMVRTEGGDTIFAIKHISFKVVADQENRDPSGETWAGFVELVFTSPPKYKEAVACSQVRGDSPCRQGTQYAWGEEQAGLPFHKIELKKEGNNWRLGEVLVYHSKEFYVSLPYANKSYWDVKEWYTKFPMIKAITCKEAESLAGPQ